MAASAPMGLIPTAAPRQVVLVTGARGFVGRHAARALQGGAHTVICLSRECPTVLARGEGVEWRSCDLLDQGSCERAVGESGANVLLHLAWDVSAGYWQAESNVRWLESSLRLARIFKDAGGQRIVLAGTCAEYDWADPQTADPLVEATANYRPQTLYGTCKHALYETVAAYGAENSMSVATGLVFFPFGIGEARDRLLPQVATALLAGRVAHTTSGRQVRDFIDVRDVGAAMAALATSDATGRVNIGRGAGISIAEFTEIVRRACNTGGKIDRGALPDRPGDPPRIVADVSRLRDEIGFTPSHTLEEGVRDAVESWRVSG